MDGPTEIRLSRLEREALTRLEQEQARLLDDVLASRGSPAGAVWDPVRDARGVVTALLRRPDGPAPAAAPDAPPPHAHASVAEEAAVGPPPQ